MLYHVLIIEDDSMVAAIDRNMWSLTTGSRWTKFLKAACPP